MIQSEENIQGDNYDIAIVVVSLESLIRGLAEGLAKRGLNILVVVPNRDYKRPDCCFQSERVNNNLFIERIPVPRLDKDRIMQKLILYYYFSYRAAKCLTQKNIALYLAQMMPVIIPYRTFLISKKKNKPFFLLLGDLVPDTWVRRKRFSQIHPFVIMIKKQTKRLLHGSEKVIAVGRDMKAYLEEKYSVPKKKIKFIPTWAKLSPDTFRNHQLPVGRFLIMYGGTISEAQKLEPLIFAAEKLAKIDASIHFQIIGSGMKKEELQKIVLNRNIKNVKFSDLQTEEEYIKSMSEASMFVVSLREESKGMSVPSKTYSYLSAGKPVLAIVPYGSEIFMEIQEDGYGIFCPPDDHEKIAQAILKVKNDNELYVKLSKNAFDAHRLKYNDQVAVKSYYELILNTLGKR